MCPYCFNHPPFKDMRKGMGCNECTHPSCQHSLANTGVSECVECDNGILVLDTTSGPKWRMACNRYYPSSFDIYTNFFTILLELLYPHKKECFILESACLFICVYGVQSTMYMSNFVSQTPPKMLLQLYDHFAYIDHILMGESNTVVSACTLYRHLQQYCSRQSNYEQVCKTIF